MAASPLVKPKGNKVKGPVTTLRKHVAVDIRLYSDFDHSGTIKETDENYDKRLSFPGAILFFACLPFSKPITSFATHADKDEIVDADHLHCCTKIKIVHNRGLAAGDEIFISAVRADADKIRLYNGAAAKARAVLGRGLSNEFKVPMSAALGASHEMMICSVAPATKEKEAVFLELKVKRAGADIFTDRCLFGLAPWLMPTTIMDAEEVYVTDSGALNAAFRSGLLAKLSPVGVRLVEMTSSGREVTPSEGTDAHWMQDMFEFGFQTRSASGSFLSHFSTVINSANSFSRPGVRGVWEDLLDQNHGMMKMDQSAPGRGSSLDSFGNLEVTPKLAGFPFGRKYFGVVDPAVGSGHDRGIETRMENFLSADPYQPETRIPTNWLMVGHVDEFLSIVPDRNKGIPNFFVLWASPRRAIALCQQLKSRKLEDSRICKGKGAGFEISVKDFLGGKDGLLSLNEAIDDLILKKIIQGILLKQWKIPFSQFIAVPTIFNGTPVGTGLESCIARTAGMVNCLVLGTGRGLLVMPDPFGPEESPGNDLFKSTAKKDVEAKTGLKVEFIDDWDSYHVLAGEVHCGTNTKRFPGTLLTDWWKPGVTIDGKTVNA